MGCLGFRWMWAVWGSVGVGCLRFRGHTEKTQRRRPTKKGQKYWKTSSERRKTQQTAGAGNTRMHGLPVGERKKFSQRNAPRKGSKVILFREIVERIRCPEGSQKSAKKAFTDWHSSFHVLPQKWALAILGPREKTIPKKNRDDF